MYNYFLFFVLVFQLITNLIINKKQILFEIVLIFLLLISFKEDFLIFI